MTRARFSHRQSPRRGMVAVQVAVSMAALMGVAALALDGGVLLAERRHAQATADAAALAAADDLYRNYRTNNGADTGGTAKSSALTTASANGYANDGTNSVVTVNIPPKAGNFIGQAGYAEVIVQYNQQRGLSGIFGSGTIPVTARAVARGAWVATTPGILLLDPTGSGSLNVSGNGNVTETGGAVVVNSNNASAAVDKGNGSMTATSFAITGSPGIKDSGNGQLTTSPTSNNITHGPPTPDPLSYLPAPNPSSLTSGSISYDKNTSTYTISPGIYGGLGGPSLPNFKQGDTVIFKQSSAGNQGIYYLAGGGLTSTGASLQMDPNSSGGIMIYNAGTGQSDGISITGNSSGTVNLSPLTSGTYSGITIFQARNAPEDLQIAGNGTFNITGTIYASDATLKITGNGTTSNIGSQYISKDLTLSGNGNISVTYNSGSVGKARYVNLVE